MSQKRFIKENRMDWKLHKKNSENYTEYLIKNKEKPDIKLKGNFNYNNRPVNFFLENPNNPITNTNLTPVPHRLNKYLKTPDDKQIFSSIQKSVITMRRIEYNNWFEENIKSRKRDKNVENYFMSQILLIQRQWKKVFHTKKFAACKIQSNFKGYIMRKYFREVSEYYSKVVKFSRILKMVFLLNLYSIVKIDKHNLKQHFITRIRKNHRQIIYLQSYVRHFLTKLHCRRVYGKKKCVFIKPVKRFNLTQLKKLQHAIILFLEKLHRRHVLVPNLTVVEKKAPMSKITLLQRFIRFILSRKKVHKLICKEPYYRSFFFTKKHSAKNAKKLNKVIKSFEKIKIPPAIKDRQSIKVKHRPKLKQLYFTKIHPKLSEVILIQRQVKIYLKKVTLTIRVLPIVNRRAYTLKLNVVPYYLRHVIFLQREIRFLLYRIKVKKNEFHKVKVEIMKFTKSIKTMTEKTFERLSRLRVAYDTELIKFLVQLTMNVKKAYARQWFYSLLAPKTRKIGVVIKLKEKPKDEFEDPLENVGKNMKEEIKNMSFSDLIAKVKKQADNPISDKSPRASRSPSVRDINELLDNSDEFEDEVVEKENENNQVPKEEDKVISIKSIQTVQSVQTFRSKENDKKEEKDKREKGKRKNKNNSFTLNENKNNYNENALSNLEAEGKFKRKKNNFPLIENKSKPHKKSKSQIILRDLDYDINEIYF